MKTWFFATLSALLIGLPSHASTVVEAGSAALEAFRLDREKAGAPLEREVVGFRAAPAGAGFDVWIYLFAGENTLTKILYTCTEPLVCSDTGTSSEMAYKGDSVEFTVPEMRDTFPLAVEQFERAAGPSASAETAKLWIHDDHLERKFGYEGRSLYVMCHPHNGATDCHRQSRPGPYEPQD